MKTIVVLVALIAAPLMAGTPGFAPVAVVPTQTARINAVMGAEPHLSQACGGVIQLRFYDSNGNVLAEKRARFTPTAVESLEFVPPPDGDRVSRTQIRADISWVVVPPGPCRSDIFANVEVYNTSSGETQFVLPGLVQQ